MRELTQREYTDVFGTNDSELLLPVVKSWNQSNPDDPVKVVRNFKNGQPIIYREQLPADLEAVLADKEKAGVVYVGGFDFGSAA